MKLDIPVFPAAMPPGRVSLGPPELVRSLGRTGFCVLTNDGVILTEGEAQFRDSAGRHEAVSAGEEMAASP